ncbi:MAG TPA: hypothetical protein VKT82_16540 [Ktedonobacterales bacterium]|nr:hypothetical protein [Ktedonobacterales bacterium]
MWQSQSPQLGTQVSSPLGKRAGIAGWWLNLTAPPRPSGILLLFERERIRKAELSSYSILAVFFFLLLLVSDTLTQPSARFAIIGMAIGLCIAALFNRSGWTRTAAYLVPLLLMVFIMAAILMISGGLSLPWLPTYDLFAIPIFLSSITLDRRAPWILAPIAIVFVLLDFQFQTRSIINIPGVVNFDHITYTERTVGYWGMVNRHVALIFFAAFFSWLGARSVEQAIARADQAEEVAKLEESFAQAEQERTELLNAFIQELVDAFVAQANGTERYLQVPPNHPLAATVQFLNQRLKRLREGGQDEVWRTRQVQAANKLLEERLGHIAMGELPLAALHASNFRTNVPQVDQLAAYMYTIGEQQRLGAGRGPASQTRPASPDTSFPPRKRPDTGPT